jgi:hypothetical protein
MCAIRPGHKHPAGVGPQIERCVERRPVAMGCLSRVSVSFCLIPVPFNPHVLKPMGFKPDAAKPLGLDVAERGELFKLSQA